MAIIGNIKKAAGTITSGRAYLDSMINNYTLRPVSAYGIGGFVFDYEGDTSVNLSADITDHFSENNTAIQDHIALRPKRLILRGFVSEVFRGSAPSLPGLLNSVNQRLETVEAYLGDNTPQMVQKMQAAVTAAANAVNTIDQSINRINNIVGLLDSAAPGTTKQQNAYAKLAALWEKKQVFTVETPYKYYENMAIESIIFMQHEDNKYQSDITVTLKEVRFAGVEFAKFDNTLYAGRLPLQNQATAAKGKTKGTSEARSTLHDFFYPSGAVAQ